MDWRKVIDSLDEQFSHAVDCVVALDGGPSKGTPWAVAAIERQKINANFCKSLSEALKSGLEKSDGSI